MNFNQTLTNKHYRTAHAVAASSILKTGLLTSIGWS